MDILVQLWTVVLAVATTCMTLFISHYVTAARLHFSQDALVRPSRTGTHRYSYSIQIKKVGGLFELMDIRASCVLSIRGLDPLRPKKVFRYSLETTFERSARFTARKRTIYLRPQNSHSLLNSHRIAEHFPEVADPSKTDLARILRFGSKAYFELVVIGLDSFTGVQRIYVSPKYRAFNLRQGEDWDVWGLAKPARRPAPLAESHIGT